MQRFPTGYGREQRQPAQRVCAGCLVDREHYTVEDAQVRELLETAIQGKGAFRRFKDALIRHQEIEQTGFAFRDARVQARMLNWFEMNEIEATLV